MDAVALKRMAVQVEWDERRRRAAAESTRQTARLAPATANGGTSALFSDIPSGLGPLQQPRAGNTVVVMTKCRNNVGLLHV